MTMGQTQGGVGCRRGSAMLYTKLVKEILRCTTHNTTSTTSKVTNASTSYEEINVHLLKAASTRQNPSHMWGGEGTTNVKESIIGGNVLWIVLIILASRRCRNSANHVRVLPLSEQDELQTTRWQREVVASISIIFSVVNFATRYTMLFTRLAVISALCASSATAFM
jgi:hypothetical protein